MVHRESHQTFYKAILICRFFNIFFVWIIKSLVMIFDEELLFLWCHSPKSPRSFRRPECLEWMCVWWAFFRHFYSFFLKWNRIIGDSRVGQDNRRSQIALQSKFKSSFAWRTSSNAPCFLKVLALESLTPTQTRSKTRSREKPLLRRCLSPFHKSKSAGRPSSLQIRTHMHAHTQGLVCLERNPQALESPWHWLEPLGLCFFFVCFFK